MSETIDSIQLFDEHQPKMPEQSFPETQRVTNYYQDPSFSVEAVMAYFAKF